MAGTVNMLIPQGLLVSIAHADDPARRWQAYQMRRDVVVDEPIAGSSGAMVFRIAEFLILTRRENLR